MLVWIVWPDCDLRQREDATIDAFWIEASEQEAELQLRDRCTGKRTMNDVRRGSLDLGGPERICFLVARDLRFVEPFDWSFPINGQWNGYSPFRELPQRYEVKTLDELWALEIPLLLRE